MFGENPIRKDSDYIAGLYRVQSIFMTIQGEGPFAGMPAVFIRLAGCNLRCTFCDTDFESGFRNVMNTDALVSQVLDIASPGCRLVVITGGEPFLQYLPPLLTSLCQKRFHCQIETAGSTIGLNHGDDLERLSIVHGVGAPYPVSGWVSVVVSPKTPKVQQFFQHYAVAYKYIIRAGFVSETDGLPNTSTQLPGEVFGPLYRPSNIFPRSQIYVQPMDLQSETLNEANTKEATSSALKFGYTLSLQLHKILGLE